MCLIMIGRSGTTLPVALTVGTGVQASGRVDVPGGFLQHAAGHSQGLPMRFAPTVSKATVSGARTLKRCVERHSLRPFPL